MTRLKQQDFIAGLSFTATGLGFALASTAYSFGSATHPGPGLIPFGLGLLLAAIGAGLAACAWLGGGNGATALPIAWRPFLVVLAAIALFGLLMERAGLLITLPLVIATVSLASPQVRWREVAISALVLTAGCWLLFIQVLGLMLPLWPRL